MTNRTVQIWGQGYGATPCSITATLNGTQVFSGSVPTVDSSDIGRLPTDQQILFTFEIPMDMSGPQAMVLEISGADLYMEQILANYYNYNTNPATGSGPSTYLAINSQSDSRENVVCTGATYVSSPPPDPRPEGEAGDWGWEVEVASGQAATFSYDLIVTAGIDLP
jgi:hypothetical protein